MCAPLPAQPPAPAIAHRTAPRSSRRAGRPAVPGDPFELERVALEAEFGEGELLAYSEVLQGILDGYPTLSVRGDTAEQCWRIVQPVIDAWHDGRVPLEEYPAGTPGPASWKTL